MTGMPPGWVYRVVVLSLLALGLLGAAGAYTVTQQGSQLLIDGTPTPITFAWGCTDPAALPYYHSLGFNTLLVRIDSLGTEALQHDAALIEAAEKEHLFVMIELANGGWSSGLRVNANDPKYVDSVKYYLQQVLPRFAKSKNLLGWVIGTVEEGQLVSDIGAFNAFLREKYGTIDNLNSSWSGIDQNGDSTTAHKSNVPSFDLLTNEQIALKVCNQTAIVRKVVQADIDTYHQYLSARDSDFQQYLHTRYATLKALNDRWDFHFESWEKVHAQTILDREKQMPGSSPFSLLELARYQSLVPARLMAWWVQQVRGQDKQHLIFAGAQRSYRSLVSLPPSINGVVTECFPGVVEVDRENHNPQAIDLARHGNRFIVIAGILARNIDAAHYANYLYIGPMHGAAGIGVFDWEVLLNSREHADITYRAMTDIWQRRLLGRVSAPSTAIVYNPYALGLTGMNKSFYGFSPGLGYYSPGFPLSIFRGGTSFGQIDLLAADDLARIPLAKYHTILLPAVFDLPTPSQDALLTFVDGGGTVVADLGVGTLQADSNLYFMPVRLQALFGIMCVPGLQEVRLNLEVYRQHPYFPSLMPGLRTTGLLGYTVMHLARVIPMPGTDYLFQMVEANKPMSLPEPHPYKPLDRVPTRGMFIAQHGRGWAIYAPFPLYQFWMPGGNTLFEEFHSDLFSKGSSVALQRPIDFLPALCQLAEYNDGSVAVWTKDQSKPVVALFNPIHRVFCTAGGTCTLGQKYSELRYDRAGYSSADPLPMLVDPLRFPVSFAPLQISPQALSFQVDTDDEHAAQPVELHFRSGLYAIKPHSSHHLMLLVDAKAGWQDQVVQADDTGRLNVTLPAARCRLYLTGTDAVVDIDHHPPTTEPPADQPMKDIIIDATPGTAGGDSRPDKDVVIDVTPTPEL